MKYKIHIAGKFYSPKLGFVEVLPRFAVCYNEYDTPLHLAFEWLLFGVHFMIIKEKK